MIQEIPYDNKKRVETGPIQFGNDWPGLFLRGDRAGYIALQIESLLNNLTTQQKADNAFSIQTLQNIKKIIQNDVIVKPPENKER